MNTRTIADLRALAQARIQSGELPCPELPTVRAGPGINKACALCRDVIPPEQTVYEVELTGEDRSSPQLLRFHFECHMVWSVVCNEKPLASID